VSKEVTVVISVVVLQNLMDLLKGEPGSSNETRVTSVLDGDEVIGIEGEMVSSMTEEEDGVPRTIPVIKTERTVSVVPVVCYRTFRIGYIQKCLPVYLCVFVKQKFDSRECISSSF
jgi:hypothetical protein